MDLITWNRTSCDFKRLKSREPAGKCTAQHVDFGCQTQCYRTKYYVQPCSRAILLTADAVTLLASSHHNLPNMAEASPSKHRSSESAHPPEPEPARESTTDGENEGASSPRSRITRAVGKGVDNLTRSFSGSTRPAPQPAAGSPSPGSRRLFSLKRKGKGRDSDGMCRIAFAS